MKKFLIAILVLLSLNANADVSAKIGVGHTGSSVTRTVEGPDQMSGFNRSGTNFNVGLEYAPKIAGDVSGLIEVSRVDSEVAEMAVPTLGLKYEVLDGISVKAGYSYVVPTKVKNNEFTSAKASNGSGYLVEVEKKLDDNVSVFVFHRSLEFNQTDSFLGMGIKSNVSTSQNGVGVSFSF